MNKIVAGALAALVLLIFLTLVLTNFLQKKESGSVPNPTLIPTQAVDRSGSTQPNFSSVIKQKNQGLLPAQQKKLSDLKTKLPYSSSDFDVAYNSDLDTFIVAKKTPGADTALKDFLSQNGVLDVYIGGSNIFSTGTGTASEIATRLKDDLLNGLESEDDSDGPAPTIAPAGKEQQKDIKLLTDITVGIQSIGKKAGGGAQQVGQITYPPNLGGPNGLGYYQMPDPTAGEYVFSPGACPAQRWGQKELIGVIYTVAQAWRAKYPDSVLRVGDLNAVEHKSHKWGVAVDITVSNQSAANTGGSHERNVELGKMFVNTGLIKNIWFCDASVDAEVMSYARANNLSLQQMSCVSGHNDHFHVDITNAHGPDSAPGC